MYFKTTVYSINILDFIAYKQLSFYDTARTVHKWTVLPEREE